jgi:hypothetical protein
MLVVCDHCKVKRSLFFDHDADEAFVREHAGHNFTGLRVVPEDFPCPNAQRRYAWTKRGEES